MADADVQENVGRTMASDAHQNIVTAPNSGCLIKGNGVLSQLQCRRAQFEEIVFVHSSEKTLRAWTGGW